jgi:hypothetical protein
MSRVLKRLAVRAHPRSSLVPLWAVLVLCGAYVSWGSTDPQTRPRHTAGARAASAIRECMPREIRSRVDRLTARAAGRPHAEQRKAQLRRIFQRYLPGGSEYEAKCFERGARRYEGVAD